MYRLKNFRWGYKDREANPGYDFIDWDVASLDWSGELTRRECRIKNGRPRFKFYSWKEVEGAKRNRKIYFSMGFDDLGYFISSNHYGRKITNKARKEFETEAINWAIEHGYIEEVKDGIKH